MFAEFVDFHGFTIQEVTSALGGTKKQAVDAGGIHYELREIFDAYMRYGGMPGIADVGLEQDKALTLLNGIYSTVIVRDILEREKRRGQQQITDAILLKKIILFLADTIGSSVSATVTAAIRLRTSFTSSYCAAAMMLPSARPALPRLISLQPRPMKSCMCR